MPLVSLIVSQQANETVDPETIMATKKEVRNLNRIRQAEQANNVKDQLPEGLKREADLASEKGSSSWLSVLPTSGKIISMK